MKILILMGLAVSLTINSCASAKECHETVKELDIQVALSDQTVQETESSELFKLQVTEYSRRSDSLESIVLVQKKQIDSMQTACNTLAARLLHARLMIENARYYLKIAIRNPNQGKFLKGWMRRALEVN